MTVVTSATDRRVVFISKATPGDDEFALWLAPRLEAAGYSVFTDILSLEPGERWRKEITGTLQKRAIKMLLCCRNSSLASDGVQEEIGIASDLVKELNDTKFIIPLRLEPFKKLFGIGELQYIDFVRGWASGLEKLLNALQRQKVPRDDSKIKISPNWELYRLRSAVPLKDEPERLTSNWLRVVETPDVIRYFEPTGAIDHAAMLRACKASRYPTEPHLRGFFSFGSLDEVNIDLSGKFFIKHEVGLTKFSQEGSSDCEIRRTEASNMLHSMLRQAWNTKCRERGLREYDYSKAVGFHITKGQAKIGQRIPWGKQGDRRSSMLRNIAKATVWEFGVSGFPALWPFPHFKLKSRVLFSPTLINDAGEPFDDARKQHRLRRTICKSWRNKQWHGRLMAFTELLSGDSSYIRLMLSETAHVKLEAQPVLFTSPVSTFLPNILDDNQEEEDVSTLGRPEPEDEP